MMEKVLDLWGWGEGGGKEGLQMPTEEKRTVTSEFIRRL
jgi:hypothetical protein